MLNKRVNKKGDAKLSHPLLGCSYLSSFGLGMSSKRLLPPVSLP